MLLVCLLALMENKVLALVRPFPGVSYRMIDRITILRAQPVEIEFLPSKVKVSAHVGDSLEEVAKNAGVEINYKCKKGECGTCEVKVDGKWIRACQGTVPAPSFGYQLRVSMRPAKVGKPSEFFSPKSFAEGVVNNGLGVVGFVRQAMKADDAFEARMERERLLQEKLAARKAAAGRESEKQSKQ